MKHLSILLFALISLSLWGCVQQKNTVTQVTILSWEKDISNIEYQSIPDTGDVVYDTSNIIAYQKINNWSLIKSVNISWVQYNILVSWNIFNYSWLFTVSLPKNLTLRAQIYQPTEGIRLDFFVDSTNYNRKQWYFKLFVEPIVSWRKEFNDQDKCIYGNYDESIESKNTKIKIVNGIETYITSVDLTAMDNKRKQWDLCFIHDNFIYMISIGGYDRTYINQIINSFKFIN